METTQFATKRIRQKKINYYTSEAPLESRVWFVCSEWMKHSFFQVIFCGTLHPNFWQTCSKLITALIPLLPSVFLCHWHFCPSVPDWGMTKGWGSEDFPSFALVCLLLNIRVTALSSQTDAKYTGFQNWRHTCRWKYWFGVSGGRTCSTWALWKIYGKNSIRNLLLVLQVRNIFYQFRPQAPRSCRGPGIKFWYRQIFSKQYARLLPESSVVNCQISVSLDGQTFTFYGLKYTLASCFVTCIVHNVIQRRCESSLYDRVGRSS